MLDSIQLTAKYGVATPANRKQGEDVISGASSGGERPLEGSMLATPLGTARRPSLR